MSDEPAAKRRVHLNTDEQADIVTLLHESLDNAKYPIEDHANNSADNDAGQKRKQTKEACKACRLSRTRCDNDGIKTVCKRCSRLGLQCVYKDQVAELHVSYGVGSPGTSVGQLIGEYGQSPKLARSPKLSACEECKIRKTKCEDSPHSNTCKECKRKGIPCIRTRYSRGRPMANYTKELLLTKASSAPIDFSKFPRVLAPFRTEQTRDVLICLSEWLDAHYIYLRQNEGSLALLFNALSCVFEQTVPEYVQDILLLKSRFSTTIDPGVYEGPSYYHAGATTSSTYQTQPGSSLYSVSNVATTFEPSISGPNSGACFLRLPLDDSIAAIRMEAISGHVNFAVSSKFIELFCEEKHINGQLHVSLAHHWWEYITAQNLGLLLEATLSHFVYSPNDDLQLPLIANVVYSKSNEYIHNHIILADKKGDKYSCVPTVACSVEDYGRSVVVMVSLRELRVNSTLDYNLGPKKKKSKLAGDISAK